VIGKGKTVNHKGHEGTRRRASGIDGTPTSPSSETDAAWILGGLIIGKISHPAGEGACAPQFLLGLGLGGRADILTNDADIAAALKESISVVRWKK
jgi:hypothetical protein